MIVGLEGDDVVHGVRHARNGDGHILGSVRGAFPWNLFARFYWV